jgi:hypothetical protein
VINLFLFPYCAKVAVLTTKDLRQLQPLEQKDLMQLQPVEAYWVVQYQKVPRYRVEIVPGLNARNAYQCLIVLPVP